MINVNNLKPGITFKENDDIFMVLDATHSKQGRGQANVKIKVKNLRTGAIIIKTYTGGNKVEKAHIETIDMDYLYNSNQAIILMDQQSFEQVEIPLAKVKWELNFLKEGQTVKVRKYKSEILDLQLPSHVGLKVIEAPDTVKGNTSTNPQKKVIVETGFELEAPMFIKPHEIIEISTATGKYVGRGK